MDRNGPIGNAGLCKIAGLDTLKASKTLKRWVDQGLLVADPNRAKRNMIYAKPVSAESAGTLGSFPAAVDNKTEGYLK